MDVLKFLSTKTLKNSTVTNLVTGMLSVCCQHVVSKPPVCCKHVASNIARICGALQIHQVCPVARTEEFLVLFLS